MRGIKTDCHWYINRKCYQDGCAALSNLQCKYKHCSFYENEEEYQARQKKFNVEHPELQNT